MGPWPVLCAQAGAGCPGLRDRPDVGARGRMSGLAWVFQMHSVMEGPDFRAKGAGCLGLREEPDVRGDGRMSRLRWTFAVLSGWPMPDFRGSGRMSGLGPDVRPL